MNSRQLGWRRAQATHLGRRLPRTEVVAAAWGGLQDSAPRAALLSLHARLDDVDPAAWEDPALAQIWFRRGADYVVPRDDVGVFTLGASPRDADQMQVLEQLATAALGVLDGRPMRTREVAAALGLDHEQQMLLKWTGVTGRLLIRWDASTIELIPNERPAIDPEDARLELARRFLAWLGPATPAQFAKWVGVSRADAETTWAGVSRELAPVTVEGEARSMLAREADLPIEPPVGVRLLPLLGDPFLAIDRDLLEPSERRPLPPVGPEVSQRLLNSLGCRILLDGDVVGAWGRVQHKVSLFTWRRLTRDEMERTEAEVATLEGPIGRRVALQWLGG